MYPASQYTTFPMEDFSAGVRTTGTFFSRVVSSPNSLNMISGQDRLLKHRSGFDDVGIPGLTQDQVVALYEYGISSSSRKQIIQVGGTIYKMDDLDHKWDVLKTGLTAGICTNFETFTASTGNILLQSSYDNGIMRYWNGVTATMNNLTTGGAPRPKYIRPWNNHVFAAGLSANPSRLVYSNVATYDQWQTDGITNYDDNCMTSDGDYITGLAVLRGNLYVFKRYSIFRVTYLGGNPLLNILKVVSGDGCISHNTLQNVQLQFVNQISGSTNREALLFLTADKRIAAFDGSTVYTLTDGVQRDNSLSPIYMDNLNEAQLVNAHSIYNRNTNEYTLFAANGGSSTIDTGITVNVMTRGVFIHDNMNFSASAIFTTPYGDQLPFVSTYTGETYRFNYGSKDKSATLVTGLKSLLHFEGDDAGTVFTDYMGKVWSTSGTAVTDTAQQKYGTSSLLLDGTTAFITTPTSSDFDFSGGIWTINIALRTTSLASAQTVWFHGTDVDNYHMLRLKTNGELEYTVVAATATVVSVTTSGAAIGTNTWYQVEVVENGNAYAIYVNGTSFGTSTDTDRPANYTGLFEIGHSTIASPEFFNGHLDEFRVLKGVAAHTTGFTAPTIAYDTRIYADVAITWYWESDLLDNKMPEKLKKFGYLSVYLKPRSNETVVIKRVAGYESTFRESRSYVVTAGSDPLGSSFVLGTSVLGGDFGCTLPYSIPEVNGFFRIRIQGSSTLESFAIHRIDVVEQNLQMGHSQYSGVTVS